VAVIGLAARAEPAFELVRAGMLTTIQDLGRPGLGRYGVSPAGAMDPIAHRVANTLVDNAPNTPALEITGPGVVVRFLRPLRFAIAGADLGATLEGGALPRISVQIAASGARLSFSGRAAGARITLACAGGLAAPHWFGSAATDVGAIGLGPAPPLRAGDTLSVVGDKSPFVGDADQNLLAEASAFLPLSSPGQTTLLRYVPEPDAGVCAAAARVFSTATFRVSLRSNRTGFRFEGAALDNPIEANRLSEPTAPGAIQLPPDGLPILLMADRNTTGGYPRLGHLCSADRGRAAQLWPGDAVRFSPVTADESHAITRTTEQSVQSWLDRCCRDRQTENPRAPAESRR
jgi:biotin-dependent carboxylase-like uncharacterized protein